MIYVQLGYQSMPTVMVGFTIFNQIYIFIK